MAQLIDAIESAWENRGELTPENASAEIVEAVEHCIRGLDAGEFRVAEPSADDWVVNEWPQEGRTAVFPDQRQRTGG